MKTCFVLFVLSFGALTSYAQSEWTWFSRNKVPLYIQGAQRFTDYRLINGKPADGFLPGYYLTADGTKKEGEIQYNFPYIMERMLVFRGEDGAVSYLRPGEIKGYFIDGTYRESVTFSASMIKDAEGLHTLFMIPKVQGPLSLYYYTNQEIVWDFEPEDDRIFKEPFYFQAFTKYNQMPEAEIHKSPC